MIELLNGDFVRPGFVLAVRVCKPSLQCDNPHQDYDYPAEVYVDLGSNDNHHTIGVQCESFEQAKAERDRIAKLAV